MRTTLGLCVAGALLVAACTGGAGPELGTGAIDSRSGTGPEQRGSGGDPATASADSPTCPPQGLVAVACPKGSFSHVDPDLLAQVLACMQASGKTDDVTLSIDCGGGLRLCGHSIVGTWSLEGSSARVCLGYGARAECEACTMVIDRSGRADGGTFFGSGTDQDASDPTAQPGQGASRSDGGP